MIVLRLDGLSLPKLIITLLVWASVFVTFAYFVQQYKVLKKIIPSNALITLLLLIIWNGFCILRSIIFIEDQLTTIFGSIYHILALLLPFLIIYATRKAHLKVIHRYFAKLLKIGIGLFMLFFIVTGGNFNDIQAAIAFFLLSPVVFLITLLPFETRKVRMLVLISVPLLFYAAYALSIRTMMLREVLLFICLLALYIYVQKNYKWILRLSSLLPLIPVALLLYSNATGVSAFQMFGFEDDSSMNTDTRSFLYVELFDDLQDSNELLIGKGANGRYYSKFFTDDLGIIADRENVEVGILGILLKGGMIAVFLNIFILIFAIYYAFFRSNNSYVIGVGFMLLIFFVLLFIENLLRYTSYNLWIWFFIGICLSKQIRSMNNAQIYALLHPMKKM